MHIGIVNNTSHTDTYFSQRDINYNLDDDDCKFCDHDTDNLNVIKNNDKNIYYSINGQTGGKKSHLTNHKWKKWTSENYLAMFDSGDIVSLLIDFDSLTISYFINGHNVSDYYNDTMFDNVTEADLCDIDFRFAVSGYYKGNCVELVSRKGVKRSNCILSSLKRKWNKTVYVTLQFLY